MKVKTIEYLRTVGGSDMSGHPDEYIIKTDKDKAINRYIYNWYQPCWAVPERFYEAMNDAENLDEAFEMYVDESKKWGLMPYTKEEVMEEWQKFRKKKINKEL